MDEGMLDALWAKVTQGDSTAFAAVYDELAPAVVAYAARMLGSGDLGEEVAQDAFLMALRRADQYRGPQKLRSWLFGIVHRTAVDALARERKQRRPVLLADPPDARREPMVADERRQILDEAIARLPVAERAVLLMRMQLELPFADIASLLDIPLNTALGRMHNALRRLRDNENLRQYFTEDLPAG